MSEKRLGPTFAGRSGGGVYSDTLSELDHRTGQVLDAIGYVAPQIGAGRSVDELLLEYPYLEREDILQALRYAAWRAEEREVVLTDA